MENASKALIIAGSVLVALLIVSLGVMVFRNTSDGLQNNAKLDKETIRSYNEPFFKYLGDSISGTEVNALILLVRSRDNECVKNEDFTTAVEISYGDKHVKIKDNKLESTLNRVETGASKYYIVTESYNNDSGLINSITIENKE